MKILLLTFLITVQIFALNPKVYAALGDKIYNNMNHIKDLKDIKEFKVYKSEIQEYYFNVNAVKALGFMLDKGDPSVSKRDYLKKLRLLSKTNDFFIETVNAAFKKAINDENSKLFLETVKSGLVDTRKNKNLIKKYYYKHKDEIDIRGSVIQDFVDEDIRNKKPVYRGPTKEELQKAKIERIRAKDKAKQEAIAKSIEEELAKKKKKIREDQKKELRAK